MNESIPPKPADYIPPALAPEGERHAFSPPKDRISVPEFTEQLVQAATANGWEVNYMSDVHGFKRPWFRKPPATQDAPCLYVSSGVHGDESAGPLACLKMLDNNVSKGFNGSEVIMIPMLNPGGINDGTRQSPDNFDINRDYKSVDSPEIHGHLEMMKSVGRLSAAISLHEDYDAYPDKNGNKHNGVFIYEQKNNLFMPGCGDGILRAMEHIMPRSHAPQIDGSDLSNGVKLLSDHNWVRDGDGSINAEARSKQLWGNEKRMETEHFHAVGLTDLSYIIETPSEGGVHPSTPKLKDDAGNYISAFANNSTGELKKPEFIEPRAFTLEDRINTHIAGVMALAENLPLLKPASAARKRESMGMTHDGITRLAGIDNKTPAAGTDRVT